MKSISLLIFLCFFVTQAHSNDFLVDDSRVAEEQNGSDSGLGLSSGTADEYIPEPTSALGEEIQDTGGYDNVRQGGLDGSNNLAEQGGGIQLAGLAMAAAFASQCGPQNPFACAAVGLSIADAIAGGGAKSAGIKQGNYLDNGGGGPGSETDPIIDQQIDELKTDLEESGYTVNADGSVTGPNGQTYTGQDFASEEAIQKAFGMGAGAAGQAMQSLQSAQTAAAKKAGISIPNRSTASEEVDEGAGGGDGSGAGKDGSGAGSAIGGVIGGDQLIEEIEYRGKKKKKKGLSAKKAAMLSKDFNGSPIGIGMADLFLIVHQKYREKKGKKNEFINKEY